MTDLPRKAIVRTARLATLPIGIAGRTALGVGKRLGGRPAELVAAELQARTAEQVFSVLGQLKGGAMKVGQAMSIFEAALPEEVAGPYRATLTKLQDSAPAMPASRVHEILRRDLGTRWRRKLPELQDTPAASASIGQVHRGRWSDGREVAVKVQYPGAGQALMSDLRTISAVLRVSAGWVPGLDLGPILDELRARMSEEVDYALEASSQQQAHDGYTAGSGGAGVGTDDGDGGDDVGAEDGGDAGADAGAEGGSAAPRVVVPAVVHARGDVLVSDWVEGRPLSEVIAEGTQAERDAAGERYLEFLLSGPAVCGLLHADPHPGNFRILADGRLGVLDWGAVGHLPDGLPPQIGPLLSLGVRGDAEGILDGLREIGFVRRNVSLDPQGLLDYLEPFLAPMREPTYTFSRAWLRDVVTTLNDPRQPAYTVGFKLNLPPDYVMVHRTFLGGIGVLSQLEATVPTGRLLERWLPGFSR